MQNNLIICPKEEKYKILSSLNNKELHNNKFMTKSEYISNYFFSYKDDAIYYLMKKYDYDIDVCRVYLNSLYFIDIEKNYKNQKLNFLKDLKKELIDNNLLYFNKIFKNYISKFNIIIKGYYDLDLYEEVAFNYSFTVPNVSLNKMVYEFSTMEDEVNFICIKICELIREGIDINKISLVNVSEDYLFTLEKFFNYYNIPINLDMKYSIYGTHIVRDYLENGNLDLSCNDSLSIKSNLVRIIGDLSSLEKDKYYNKLLRDRLKNTYIKNKVYDKAVSIKDLFKDSFDSDEYVFVLGFNQDVLPKIYKDTAFIDDKAKEEVDLYKTDYLNNREKRLVTYLLSKINNLYLTYKLESFFQSFSRSSLIDDLGLEVVDDYSFNYNYSDTYNKIKLGEKLDMFYLYGEYDKDLELLNSNYDISYNSYDNKYSFIDKDKYLTHLDYPLKLSYTSLNSYNECKFKYYIKYVLKLDSFTESFSTFIGSMYHKILTLYRKSDFNLDEEINNYIGKRELSLKERLLLVRIKDELSIFINELKRQDNITGYDEVYYEKGMEVVVREDISVKFIGYIDKIMARREVEDVYFSIVDYKSGVIDTSIEVMKYGLHMQLPVYLYLIHYSRCFSNPIFTGIYYQNILFNYPTWSKTIEKDLSNRYLLKGYSTDKIDILEKFDSTYQDSEMIKSMKYSEEGGFSRYTKLIDDDTLYNMVKFTKKHIEDKTNDILDGDFSINPKVYNMNNVSCKYCSFKDLCFMRDSDIEYLETVSDLSFLGGDN